MVRKIINPFANHPLSFSSKAQFSDPNPERNINYYETLTTRLTNYGVNVEVQIDVEDFYKYRAHHIIKVGIWQSKVKPFKVH
jgi:hypothetical protein